MCPLPMLTKPRREVGLGDPCTLQTALKGRWEKRAGRGVTAQLGLRKLQEVGWGQVKMASHSLKGHGWGYLHLQEYQRRARHSMVTSFNLGKC